MKKTEFGQLPAPLDDPRPLQQSLRLAVLVVAHAGALAGAVLSMLPAVVLGLVTMFYNSAGGVLIFLGGLIPTLPRSVMNGHGSSALPVFQQLDSDPSTVMLRSAAAAGLCWIAVAAMILASRRKRDGRLWLVVGLCCLLAAVAGGRSIAFCVMPAFAASVGHLIHHKMRRGMNLIRCGQSRLPDLPLRMSLPNGWAGRVSALGRRWWPGQVTWSTGGANSSARDWPCCVVRERARVARSPTDWHIRPESPVIGESVQNLW